MAQPSIHFTNKMTEILSAHNKTLSSESSEPLKLIIHVGTPKTGTTSIQNYLDKKQRKLRGRGILYPHNLKTLHNTNAPKHQWFEKNLVTVHVDNFLSNFKNIISQVKDNTHTIILSSEGIYNYWWDFPNESKAVLSELSNHFNVQIWAWFDEPLSFIENFYKQCIRNPSVDSNPCYGKDLSFAEMIDIDWFSQHLDYLGFITECEKLFGKDNVSAFKFEGDVVQQVIQKLGLATPHDNPTKRKNQTLNSASISILRTINQYNINAKERELLMPHLKAINELLSGYKSDTLIDDTSKKRVLQTANTLSL